MHTCAPFAVITLFHQEGKWLVLKSKGGEGEYSKFRGGGAPIVASYSYVHVYNNIIKQKKNSSFIYNCTLSTWNTIPFPKQPFTRTLWYMCTYIAAKKCIDLILRNVNIPWHFRTSLVTLQLDKGVQNYLIKEDTSFNQDAMKHLKNVIDIANNSTRLH